MYFTCNHGFTPWTNGQHYVKLRVTLKCNILYATYVPRRTQVLLIYEYVWAPQADLTNVLFICISVVHSNSNFLTDKKFSYRRYSAWCGWHGHSRSLKVTRCCANRRCICDFLLAVNSNLTSIFKCSWDITPSLRIITTSVPGGTGKRRLGVGGHALVSGCPENWTIQQ